MPGHRSRVTGSGARSRARSLHERDHLGSLPRKFETLARDDLGIAELTLDLGETKALEVLDRFGFKLVPVSVVCEPAREIQDRAHGIRARRAHYLGAIRVGGPADKLPHNLRFGVPLDSQ